jgi:dienelactone hydrolase
MLVLLLACVPSPADTADTDPTPVDYAAPGPYTPARRTSTLDGDRPLTIETWYPSEDAAGTSASILDLVVDPDDRATYEALLAAAPADCPTRTIDAVPDAALASGGPWPVIAMSHCHGCTRFSTNAVAEHLASHGFVVVAPDHAGNTLFDELAGTGLPLDTDTLALREADLDAALDATLAGDLDADPSRVGVFGHSFGAVTAGIVTQDRTDVAAAMFVGAPPDNPLLPGVTIEDLDVPLFFEKLAEDHSVGTAGNVLIQSNYEAAPGPAWLLEMADAGHWSPSDLVGVTDGFMPGCGDDTRESTREAFTYLPPAEGRALTAAVAAAFFTRYVGGVDETWLEDLEDARVSIEGR